jgi:membrane protein DedA with SNARE-associated domain
MAIESCCIPLPSELVMPLAGIMIVNGKLLHGTNTLVALLLVALAGAAGCLIGSIIAYIIGYTGGRPLLLKYGRYLLISQHDADKADQFFQRWGSETTFFSRLLPVVRTYISLPAGIAKMPFAKFCIYTVLGSFPWCLLLAYVGTIIGGNLATLSPIFHTFDVVILIVLVLLIALYIRRHIRNDRKARANLASAEASARQSPPQPQPQNWGQQSQPQNWGQQPQSQQEWGQQPQPQNWGQQSQPQQNPGQPLRSQFQPPQPPWMEPQQPWPPRGNDNDRTVRRG